MSLAPLFYPLFRYTLECFKVPLDALR
jgi:hypothetical protein